MITAFLLGLSLGACIFTLAWMRIVAGWRRTAENWKQASAKWEAIAKKWQDNYTLATKITDAQLESTSLMRQLGNRPRNN